MSVQLDNFKKSYADLSHYPVEIIQDLIKSYILNKKVSEFIAFFKSYEHNLKNLDSKILGELRALSIYLQIYQKLLPKIFPNLVVQLQSFLSAYGQQQSFQSTYILLQSLQNKYNQNPECFSEILSNPRKLNPQEVYEALDSIKQIAQATLEHANNNQTWAEMVLNFLKSCANFLITMVTFGQKPNFFKSTTFELERIIRLQHDLHDIFNSLSPQEKVDPLDWPTLNFENPMLRM